jgi:hypothetical protein
LIACACQPHPGIYPKPGTPLKLCQAAALYPSDNYPPTGQYC